MLRETLQSTIEAAVAALVREGRLPATVADVPVEISDTKSIEHGDYACNFALTASKKAGMNPRALGEALKDALLPHEGLPPSGEGQGWGGELIAAVEVAGPGFLNLRLHPEAVAAYVEDILATENLAHIENPSPQRINVEFVSVNPNGPITIGSGRGAAFGSALCNVLEATGNVVHREYYINDGVNSEQMRLFAESVRSLALGLALPEKGYKGDYVGDVAQQAKSDIDAWERVLVKQVEALTARLAPLKAQASQLLGQDKIDDDLWRSTASRLPNADQVRSAISDSNKRDDLASFVREAKEELESIQNRRHIRRQLAVRIQHELVDLTAESESLTDILRGFPMQQAKDIFEAYGANVFHLPVVAFQIISQAKMLQRQREDLDHFGVIFDTWFSEQSLHDQGIVANRIDGLKQTGVADEEPYRTKLKLGKGGIIEETIREDQPNEDEGEEETGTTHNPQPTTHNTLWLRSTKFGDDMDRVLRRRDGRLTYIASDVSYHENKLTRPPNATKMITILGPDHHGYIGRLTAVVAALLRGPEDTPEANAAALATAKEKLEVVIYQLVRFLKDGKPAPMRKRDGNIYELRDLLDELGKNLVPDGTREEQQTTGRDVARFFYLMRSHDTTMDFDIDLATQQSDENPVFYAQYAHARIASVLRKAQEAPLSSPRVESLNADSLPTSDERGVGGRENAAYRLLTHPRETALIKKILDLPWEVERVAKDYGVHRLTTYAVELARTYHHFYDACRVLQEDQPELTQARLALCRAAKKALKSTFDLLGVSAPERLDRRAVPESA